MVVLDRKKGNTVFLVDACVLIDYQDSDMTALKLVAEHIGDVVVVSRVLQEVRGFSEQELEQHKIRIFEADEDLIAEAERVMTSVSLNDSLCMVACRQRGWTCVTNDRSLRRLCERHGVPTRFGLGLMVDLVAVGGMTKQNAKEVARLIQESNSRFISIEILREFEMKVDTISNT